MECLDATLKKPNMKKIARYGSFKKAILESLTITAAQTIAWQKFVARKLPSYVRRSKLN